VKGSRVWQVGANLATGANALLGVGAIAYTVAGNKLFALLLLTGAIGFDGLDGWLHRRGGGGPTLSGRVLDSAADSISFAAAPAVLLIIHTYAASVFAPYNLLALLVGIWVGSLAIARLVYFTLRSYARPYFVGASTPQTTLALVVLLLFADQPGYLGHQPLLLLIGAALLAPLMVLPVPFPKVRRGARLRLLMTLTGVALAVTLVPAQFVPATGSPFYLLGEGAATLSLLGVALYYIVGPWSARADARESSDGAAHA
jgi:phosphatidylserine synthase